jgi:hypothetical protein
VRGRAVCGMAKVGSMAHYAAMATQEVDPAMGFWRELRSGWSSNLCPACEGSGWAVKTREEKRICPACEGTGNTDRDWRLSDGI